MMEILHLLPAAFETLFSVYWLSACHFCTVDVNSEKRKKKNSNNNTGVVQKQRHVHTRENVRSVAPPDNFQSSIFFLLLNQRQTCNDITMKLLLSPGPNHTSPLLLHQRLPVFPVVLGIWLAGFHWQRHLTFTVIWNLRATEPEQRSERSDAATTRSGDSQ